VLYNIRPETSTFPETRHPSVVRTHFSTVLFVKMIRRVFGCTQYAQCTEDRSFVRMIVRYTHDESCDMILTLGDCNNPVGTDVSEFGLHCSC
jgi:hypothetical protein